jgi:hypothetical protein
LRFGLNGPRTREETTVDIGRPQRIIEIEPVSLPVPAPDLPEPMTEPIVEPMPETAPAEPSPAEPVDP